MPILCHPANKNSDYVLSQVHLVGVKPASGVTVTKGKEHVKVVHDPAGGKMEVRHVLFSCSNLLDNSHQVVIPAWILHELRLWTVSITHRSTISCSFSNKFSI